MVVKVAVDPIEDDTRRVPLLSGNGVDLRKEAWVAGDVQGSRDAHRAMLGAVPLASKVHLQRDAQNSSDLLRAVIFGGLDGIATIFATVAGCLGAQLTPLQILIVGAGNLLANAIAMGFGEYLSCGAEDDFIASEREREEWEVDNCPEEEKREMVEIYEHRYGFTKEDANLLIETAFKYKNFFISHMMAEELGLLVFDGDEGGSKPAKRGFLMFFSFTIFGMVPLLSFLLIHIGVFRFMPQSTAFSFGATAVVSSLTLFILGVLKSQFVAQNPLKAGFGMMMNGSVAGLVAFLVGYSLQSIAGAHMLD